MKYTVGKNVRRFFIIPMVSAVMGLNVLLSPFTAYGAVIYEVIEKETVSTGILYEKSTQVAESGLLDVHVLKIDITNANVEIKPIASSGAYGTKDTVLKMVQDSGALAGVNGDFFDMGLSPATPFGTVIADGKIISMDEEHEGYATFFIDNDNNPFIEYIKPDVIFLNNGENNIKVHAMNKYKRDFSAVYYDRTAMTNTAQLDAKFPDLVKFVVTDNVITYISKGGETVEIPENGYIIMTAATYAQYFYNSVKVGDTAEIKIEARFDFNSMKEAIGGAGKILEAGNYSNYGYVVGAGARNPRTAIGISQDGTQIVLVAVDGRSHSVGATHQEMAEIMKRYGAYNAMHLDGGGSTTMVADTNESSGLEIKNTLSEGSQRKVINGVGVFNTAPVGAAVTMNINLSADKVFAGSPITINAVGLDENSRKTTLPAELITYSSSDLNGRFEGNVFYPSTPGLVNVQAVYNGFTQEKAIEVLKLAQLVPLKDSLAMTVGQNATLSFEGISTSGTSAPITGVQYEVVPAELGEVVDNVFYAKGGKSGYIKCYMGDVATYIDVTLGTETRWIDNFNNPEKNPIEFAASGTGVKGRAYYSDAPNGPGNNALALEYSFSQSDQTQAAYLQFKNPIALEKGISSLVISAYGLNNGGWLRAKITDANGNAHLLDMTKDFNQKGWGQFIMKVPEDAVQPLKLERLYIAALSNTDTETKTVYFDDLSGLFPISGGAVQKPQSTTYQNPYEANLETPASGEAFDITIAGSIALAKEKQPENYLELQNNALKNFRKDTSYAIYAGASDIENPAGNAYVKTSGYNFTKANNYALIQMSTAKGGIASTNPYAWAFVEQAKASPVQHIIILLDKKPSNFSSVVEYKLFKNALNEIKASGKNVFVVSTEGLSNSAQMIDNINYINLGGLFNSDNTVNQNFSTLRLRISGANIYYQVQKSN